MTKLEFLDKINDILIGLNTAESDALGSLYDELMRDNNWSQVRIQAAIAAMGVVKGAYNVHNDMERLVHHAVRMADALVAELQKKGGQDD